MNTIRFGLALATLVVSATTADAATRYAGPFGYPTIQAAVDAAQPGDTIQLYPQLWAESVKITKPLTIEKHPSLSGTAAIVGNATGALNLDLHNGEGVTIRSLTLFGSGGPVVRGPTWVYAGKAPRVALTSVAIHNGTLGVSGFANLVMSHSTVKNTSSHGIGITGGADLYNVTVDNTGGAGIFINTFNGGVIANRIRNVRVVNTDDVGILIDGARNGSFWLASVEVERATKAGIFFKNADGAQVDNSVIEMTRTLDGAWGDGLFAQDSEGVDLYNVSVVDNERAGVAAFGASILWLSECEMIGNPIDLNYETGGRLEDEGGNTCWEAPGDERVCAARSSVLSPPSLPPLPRP